VSELYRQPPASIEAEQAVLGACLISERAIDDALTVLDGDEWYHAPHRAIWQALTWLRNEGIAADQITVADELQHLGKLDEAGGHVYLARLASETATARNAGHHARIVRRLWQAREFIARAQAFAARAYDGRDDVTALLQAAQADLAKLEGAGDQQTPDYDAVLADTLARLETLLASGGALPGLPTGFPELDRLTGGWQPGSLVIIAARPSVGKSALALLEADVAARAGHAVVIFSVEMPRWQLGQRHLAMACNVACDAIRLGTVSPEELATLKRTKGELGKLPITIDDRQDVSMADIATTCRKHHRAGKLALVIVDYLQELRAHGRADNREQEVAGIARAAKRLARELAVPVLLLSQLSRDIEHRADQRPQLSDLRESGAIEQEADVAMFISRPEMHNRDTLVFRHHGEEVELPSAGLAELIVAKNRNGARGSLLARWDEAITAFSPYTLDTRHTEVAWAGGYHDND
jgi:replicative DNA helicase